MFNFLAGLAVLVLLLWTPYIVSASLQRIRYFLASHGYTFTKSRGAIVARKLEI